MIAPALALAILVGLVVVLAGGFLLRLLGWAAVLCGLLGTAFTGGGVLGLLIAAGGALMVALGHSRLLDRRGRRA